MLNKKYIIVEGYIATEKDKPFYGQIKINNQSGLISNIQKEKQWVADYIFKKDSLIFAGFGDIHIHARKDQTGKQKYKKDYKTVTKSALNGGCVHISAMPNTPKPLTTNQPRPTSTSY